MKTLFLILGLGVSISCWTVNSCLGQSFWDNNLGGDFHFPGNWIPGPPGPMDEAIFQIPGTAYTITFMTTANSGPVTVQDGEVTFDLFDQAYNVLGNVSINNPFSSLTVDGGNLNVSGPIEVFSGATLKGNGVLNGSSLSIGESSTLGGTLIFNSMGTLTNAGRVAPGNSGGIGTLSVNSNYQQFDDGTLEIEIDGSVPSNENDLLQHSGGGTVTLAGKLSVPFIGGYMPQANDTFTFLDSSMPSGGIIGKFGSISLPGLTSGLAARIDYTATTASVTFVTSTNRQFFPGVLSPVLPNYWGTPTFWGGGLVPDSTNSVNLVNNTVNDLTIALKVDPQDPANMDAITHFTLVSGTTNTMTLSVPAGTNFTAVQELNINNNGILNLDGGTVHSNLVKIDPGGLLKGDGGTIKGTLQVGTNIPSSIPAVFSPGNSPGTSTIDGDLEINSNGMLDIDVVDMNSFDLVTVTQTANLAGTLNVVASAIPPLPTDGSMGVTILTAANVDQKFENVMTTSTSDFYFAPRYDSGSVSLLSFLDGDMNQNGMRNGEDVSFFAMAVTDPDGYFDLFDMYGEGSGDINDDGFFDFDDIEPFSQLSGIGLTAEEIVAVIEAFQQPVPEPDTLLGFCLALGSLVASRRLSSNRSSKAA